MAPGTGSLCVSSGVRRRLHEAPGMEQRVASLARSSELLRHGVGGVIFPTCQESIQMPRGAL